MMLSSGLDWSRRLRLLSTITSLTRLERREPRTRPGGLATNHIPVLSPPIEFISRRFSDISVRLGSIVLHTYSTSRKCRSLFVERFLSDSDRHLRPASQVKGKS